jgi:hypothetical protein
MHPRGNFCKGIEVVIDGKIYHPVKAVDLTISMDMEAKSYQARGHSTQFTVDWKTRLVTLWVSRKDEDFKQAQKASNEYAQEEIEDATES